MPVTKNTQHGMVDREDVLQGKFSLVAYHLESKASAQPIVPVVIENIQEFSIGERTFNEQTTLHFGGGNVKRITRDNGRVEGSIKMLGGAIFEFMAEIFGQTWTNAGLAALNFVPPTYPLAHIELVCREVDNETPLFSIILQDVVFKPFTLPLNLEQSDGIINWYSEYDAIAIPYNTHFVLDKWDGTGVAVDFSMSETPLELVSLSTEGNEDWDYTHALFIKEQLTGEVTGTRLATYTITPGTPKITAPAAPAGTTEIYCGYVATDS